MNIAVDPAMSDWCHATEETFTNLLPQDSGPLNPLGKIKFLFPRMKLYLAQGRGARGEKKIYTCSSLRPQPFGGACTERVEVLKVNSVSASFVAWVERSETRGYGTRRELPNPSLERGDLDVSFRRSAA
ncbi:MAG TPA: hypothetical protein PLG17_07135 [Thermodesulfobacteriota bacterium]|nr:hypothetical protein [Deltaproteobacteria bacterium]HNR13043.1 hypothetical protein [Thermodesulfobacteriota bacterium]HNU72637.1 hypothetical protein [Thermodesulfobacteriota bacterium]HQO78269.1 hypothetical protein [Thermodesulfobacteriota bacterium]